MEDFTSPELRDCPDETATVCPAVALTVGILKTKGFSECDPDWTLEDDIVATSESCMEDPADVLLSVEDIDDAKRLDPCNKEEI